MSETQNTAARITQYVYDFMTIELSDISFNPLNAGYKIYNSINHLIRQGNFSGPAVQLRVSHLEQGDYFLQLCLNEKELGCYRFSKLCQ